MIVKTRVTNPTNTKQSYSWAGLGGLQLDPGQSIDIDGCLYTKNVGSPGNRVQIDSDMAIRRVDILVLTDLPIAPLGAPAPATAQPPPVVTTSATPPATTSEPAAITIVAPPKSPRRLRREARAARIAAKRAATQTAVVTLSTTTIAESVEADDAEPAGDNILGMGFVAVADDSPGAEDEEDAGPLRSAPVDLFTGDKVDDSFSKPPVERLEDVLWKDAAVQPAPPPPPVVKEEFNIMPQAKPAAVVAEEFNMAVDKPVGDLQVNDKPQEAGPAADHPEHVATKRARRKFAIKRDALRVMTIEQLREMAKSLGLGEPPADASKTALIRFILDNMANAPQA